jgi:hypothetical protein
VSDTPAVQSARAHVLVTTPPRSGRGRWRTLANMRIVVDGHDREAFEVACERLAATRFRQRPLRLDARCSCCGTLVTVRLSAPADVGVDARPVAG